MYFVLPFWLLASTFCPSPFKYLIFSPFGKRKSLKIARIEDKYLDKYLTSYKEKANKLNLFMTNMYLVGPIN